MKFGLALPHYDFSLPGKARVTWDDLSGFAVHAEHLGFDSLWISDHILFDVAKYGGPAEACETFEWVTTLGALARVTSQIRLGVLVACAPLRSAPITAKSAATLDQISEGRFELGLGAGWYRPDFDLTGVEFRSAQIRIDDLVETALAISSLLTGEGVAALTPAPVQKPRPPIFFGGKGGGHLLDAVAKAADGWNLAWSVTPERYESLIANLATACERRDRDPASVSLSVGLTTLVGRNETDFVRRFERMTAGTWPLPPDSIAELKAARLAGTPSEVEDRIGTFEALGVKEIISCFGPAPFMVAVPDDLDFFAETIISGVARSRSARANTVGREAWE